MAITEKVKNNRWYNADGKPAGTGTMSGTRKWWTIDSDKRADLAASITSAVTDLTRASADQRRALAAQARLYSNMPMASLNLAVDSRPQQFKMGPMDRVTFNVIQSVIDTVQSKMAKNRPWPLFLTDGGDYRQQLKAKRSNKFMEGVYFENHMYQVAPEVFRDSELWGTGALHVYIEHGRVRYERVPMIEFLIDELEGIYGNPRQLHRIKAVDRDVLMACVRAWHEGDGTPPKVLDEMVGRVRDSSPARLDNIGSSSNNNDLVAVFESWHLPDGPGATDDEPMGGRHVISIPGAVLLDEPYVRQRFPFAFLRWTRRPWGFWGQGLAEQLNSIQLEVNKLLWIIQRSFQLAGSFKWFVKIGSEVPSEHINGTIAGIVYYAGDTPPQLGAAPPVPEQYFVQLERLAQRAYEQAGVSMLSAQSKKPEGLDSGRAIREFNDIESDRFQIIGQQYEQFFLDVTELTLDAVREAAGKGKAYEIKVPKGSGFELLDWKHIGMDEDSYVCQVYPVSSFPNTPAGRMQTVTEQVQAGWMRPETGRRLMNYPDLEAVESLADAQEEYNTMVLDRIIEDGKMTVPEPYDNPERAREMAVQYYTRGKLQGLEPERLGLLRRYIDQIDNMIEQAKQAQLAAAAAAQAAIEPQAKPMPQPKSDLVPNVPGAGPAVV